MNMVVFDQEADTDQLFQAALSVHTAGQILAQMKTKAEELSIPMTEFLIWLVRKNEQLRTIAASDLLINHDGIPTEYLRYIMFFSPAHSETAWQKLLRQNPTLNDLLWVAQNLTLFLTRANKEISERRNVDYAKEIALPVLQKIASCQE